MLIDTGDRIEGNGLYDASDPKGLYTYEIFKEQDIDIICAGNHELYQKISSDNEYFKTVPNFHGNYLASNIDIFNPKTRARMPLAPRFKKFTTKNQGIRVLAFGFLFDFTRNANNTVVQFVTETIKEDWFQDAIRDRDVDLFLVAGHVPLRSEEFNSIYKAIREVQWDTPIQFFGGHTHVRDYSKYDSKAFAIESGRYMETIGFASITGLNTGGKSKDRSEGASTKSWPLASPEFARRYIDNNVLSYYHHTSLNSTSFHTLHGRNVSALISSARKALKLDHRFGCAPFDLWTNRAPFPSKNSIFSWLQDHVFPGSIYDANRGNKPRLVLVNTGALRFDIFEGAFTVDTTYTVSPFNNTFRYIKDVPYGVAKGLLDLLNNGAKVALSGPGLGAKLPVSFEQLKSQQETPAFNAPLAGGFQNQIILDSDGPALVPGYTTVDDAGSDGDDTLHSPIKFYKVPTFIQSRISFPSKVGKNLAPDVDHVDVVFVDFVQPYILLALKSLGGEYHAVNDTNVYMEGVTMIDVIAGWVKKNWDGNC